jgi:hypothetical protein
MKLRKYLNELIMKKDGRSELRDAIINSLEPGALILDRAIKKSKGDIVLKERDAKILMTGIKRVLEFLNRIGIEK